MTRLEQAGIGALCVGLMTATASVADVTPEQVWQSWQKGYQDYGYQVSTGGTDRSGDTLTLSDIKLVHSSDGANLTMTIPKLVLRDQGDGTVAATLPEKMTGVATQTLPQKDPTHLDMVLTQTGTQIVVSGAPEDMAYKIDAPTMTIALNGKTDTPEGEVPLVISATLEKTAGTYHMKQGDAHDVDSQLTTDLLRFSTSAASADQQGTLNLTGQVSSLAYQSKIHMPKGTSLSDPRAAIEAGMTVDYTGSYGPLDFDLNVDAPDGKSEAKGSLQSGTLAMNTDAGQLHYAFGAQTGRIDLSGGKMPAPVSAGFDDLSGDIALGTGKGQQPYSAKVALNGVGLVEPKDGSKTDLMSLNLDLDGKATVAGVSGAMTGTTNGKPPVHFDTINLNALHLNLLGADLNGKGALTVDNAGPVPDPVGTLDFTLTGVNKLMNTLAASGMVPQQMIGMGPMFLGLYAKQTGDDAYATQIEFKKGGQILANGQRVH